MYFSALFGTVHRRVELQSGKVVFCVFDTVFLYLASQDAIEVMFVTE